MQRRLFIAATASTPGSPKSMPEWRTVSGSAVKAATIASSSSPSFSPIRKSPVRIRTT